MLRAHVHDHLIGERFEFYNFAFSLLCVFHNVGSATLKIGLNFFTIPICFPLYMILLLRLNVKSYPVFFKTKKCYTSVTCYVQRLPLQTSVPPKFKGIFISMIGCEKNQKCDIFGFLMIPYKVKNSVFQYLIWHAHTAINFRFFVIFAEGVSLPIVGK